MKKFGGGEISKIFFSNIMGKMGWPWAEIGCGPK